MADKQNLAKKIDLNTKQDILVSGNIPGAKNSLVLIKSAVKKSGEKAPEKEIISYEDEKETDEKEEDAVAGGQLHGGSGESERTERVY